MRPPFPPAEAATSVVESLRRQVQAIESGRPMEEAARCSTGCAELDQTLPGGGLMCGSLVEWLSAEPGSGAATLALMAAKQACQPGGALVVIDYGSSFYPPAAAAWGIDLERTVVVRCDDCDRLWAMDNALRCAGVAAVWATVERLSPNDFRRLQLAAESGGGLGLLLRPPRSRGLPSWSETQFWVEPRPSQESRRVRVELLRCRGAAGKALVLELDERRGMARQVSESHETHSVPVAAALAAATPGRRSARA